MDPQVFYVVENAGIDDMMGPDQDLTRIRTDGFDDYPYYFCCIPSVMLAPMPT
jgi:hypothetical protein